MKLPEKLQGKRWSTPEGDVTSEQLVGVLAAIQEGAPRATAIPGAMGDSDRRVDRATQLLRKAGLIKWVGGREKWRVVDSGRST